MRKRIDNKEQRQPEKTAEKEFKNNLERLKKYFAYRKNYQKSQNVPEKF